ncbi:J domain-containing protein [Rhizobium herbae]|uniref:J domain-containing protein n=1 Tax=Rhizobium herbae TaxID=508661 RepID=A0ABS4EVW2_9HYPH|nr:J domain-containing protein [Rhizobium herbae]MBP1862106.1 hypothetical protein [Rhizobium herbae]
MDGQHAADAACVQGTPVFTKPIEVASLSMRTRCKDRIDSGLLTARGSGSDFAKSCRGDARHPYRCYDTRFKKYSWALDLLAKNPLPPANPLARNACGTRVNQTTEIPIPSTVRSGSAKTLNARKTAAARQAQSSGLQRRKLKVLEAKAFETFGLLPAATLEEIRSRYKERLKMHHPDANPFDPPQIARHSPPC